ncbi:peptide chain release factor 2 [Bartonella taylorii]|uniref:Peptide chain release factor 2 n=2 Tax=Bartonella taylorii TaxID=33046 RepID=A0A9Q9DMD5_BARTA|nr:peptide chain release factor 2 [Bartonella taylorii]USP01904.1 peptide chain release factor 2 [Bartonella taylorii]USP03099.1 peptide chain release factor 2 [Bartonella taylorii]
MRAEIETLVDEIQKAIKLLRGHLDWDQSLKRLEYLNQKAEDPTLWDNAQQAQDMMRERQHLDDSINGIRSFTKTLEECIELIAMGEEESDIEIITDAENSIRNLKSEIDKRQIDVLLSGEVDPNDTYLEVHAGAGGTESQDWASMLLRMYTRWAEQHKMKVEILEIHDGEEAGIKSATILVKGHNAYGMLKTESGVHRLVRISPFDSNAKRHTSFASIWVYPVIDDNIEVDVSEADVRIDTYRASGAGGQHVNTTDSAVRITHIKTGIVVQCQTERSQHKNRATAWSMLRARLYEEELKKREEETNAVEASKTEIGWGHQIRSYVLQPYQLVKDLRTGVENTDPQSVLNGNLDAFIEATLAQRLYGKGQEIEDTD